LHKQKSNLHDLLEQEIYTVEMFLKRSQTLSNRIDEVNNKIAKVKELIEFEHKKESAHNDIIPNLEYILDQYKLFNDAKYKNKLLKTVLDRIEYKKEKHQTRDDFSLFIYPKLPS